jgi:hypothetical protein
LVPLLMSIMQIEFVISIAGHMQPPDLGGRAMMAALRWLARVYTSPGNAPAKVRT